MNYPNCALLLAAIALAAGCTPDGPPPLVPGSSAGQVQAPSVGNAEGMLKLDPAIVDLCKQSDGLMAADIGWNAATAGTKGVEVWVHAPGERKKLWLAGGAVDSARTGRWLRDGTVVTLVNAENEQTLADVQIAAQACRQ